MAVIWDFIANYGKKAAILHTICLECGAIENELRELWTDIDTNTANEDEIRASHKRLVQRLHNVTGWAGHADISVNNQMNEESEKFANSIMDQRYKSDRGYAT